MKTLLATTALVLCTLGTATAQAAGIEFAPARLMFDPTPVAEWDQRPDSEAAPTTITLTQSRQWYWARYRATHPLTTTVAQVRAYEEAQQQQVEIVQATRCPVLRGEPDYDWCNQQAAPVPYLPDVPIFVVHVPATQPDNARTEVSEAAPIGLVGEPYPPGIEQQPGGIGSDYVAQAKADRAVAQTNVCPQPTAEDDARLCNPQATTAAIKEDALAAKDAAVLSAHAEAKPKRTRTH
jgi:hypothetical protein